ncbi:MAG: EAL domain-containing protein [Methylophilaceae bacterium]
MQTLRILLVEDNPADAELTLRELKRSEIKCEARRVETESDFRIQLDQFDPDIILSDFSLPSFDGLSALHIARKEKPDIPFIFVSGTIGEETAIESLKQGAVDYIIKSNLSRLPSAVRSALERVEEKTAHKRIQKDLDKSTRLFRVFMENLPAIAFIKDANAKYIFANRSATEKLNIPYEEIIGCNTAKLFPQEVVNKFDEMDQQALESGTSVQKIHQITHHNQEAYWMITTFPLEDDEGRFNHVGVIAVDITEQRKAEEALEHQANYDMLTGLANRNLLKERIKQAFHDGRRHAWVFTVAFIDIDNFKRVNDSLGHTAGDELIKMLGQRLLMCVRDTDTVSRVGGDEFVVLLNSQSHEENTQVVVQRFRNELLQPFLISDKSLTITCSIGLASFPRDGETPEILLSNADSAMYRAKANGRNNFQFYAKEMNAELGSHLALEQDLWHALSKNELLLHYQPQIDLATGQIIGMEALIRWEHPKLGLISPLRFIPIAEENGLIIPIGKWVLETACRNNCQLQKEGSSIRVAINLSARQLGQKDLLNTVKEILLHTGMDPEYLELEITESMIMHNVEEAINILCKIHDLGIQLSLDDFGTGYSSLAYLKRFPINRLKIDKSFIRDIATDPNDAIISRSIITLAHSLQVQVIAEGVETAEQLAFLKDNGCNEVQGYYFSKPVPFEQIQLLLDKERKPIS